MKFVIMEAWHFNNCMPMKIHLITGFRQEVTLKIIPQIVRCLFYLSGWFSFNLVHTDWQFQSSVADLQCKKKEKKKTSFNWISAAFFLLFHQFSVWFSLNILYDKCVFGIFGHHIWNFILSTEQKMCLLRIHFWWKSKSRSLGAVVFSLHCHKSCLW